MIEPTMAVSLVLTSKPPGSSPGRIALAIAPAIRPSRIQPMMPMISPSFGPSAVAVSAVSYRLCFRSVPRVVWTPTGRSKPLATTRMKTSGIPHQTWVWDEGSSKPRDYVALEAETLHPREQGRPGTPGAGTGRREAGMRTPFTGRWRRLSGAPVAASVAVALAIGFVGSSRVQVAFADGRRVAGTVKAADQVTDLAIVQAQRSGLPPATFQPKLPQVGELAIAIGSPLGFENTVTAG